MSFPWFLVDFSWISLDFDGRQGEGEDAAALQALITHAKEEAQRAAEQKLREKERQLDFQAI